MAERAIWKGYLKLSLVSCAVALYPSTNASSQIRFTTLNRKTGNRVQRQFIDSETHEVVETEDQVKGYPVGKGHYIVVEDEELDALKLESTHSIDIEHFVPRDEVDERFLDKAYYIAPDDKVAQEAFAVIRDAIHDKGMAGLGRVVMARRERLLLLEPLDDGLVGTTLHTNDVRDAGAVFDDIPKIHYPKEMKDLAAHIIDSKTTHFDPKLFEDRYENAVADLVKSKQTGHNLQTPSSSKPSNVVNLMDALKRSIAAEKTASPARNKPTSDKKSSKRPASKKGSGGSKSFKRAG